MLQTVHDLHAHRDRQTQRKREHDSTNHMETHRVYKERYRNWRPQAGCQKCPALPPGTENTQCSHSNRGHVRSRHGASSPSLSGGETTRQKTSSKCHIRSRIQMGSYSVGRGAEKATQTTQNISGRLSLRTAQNASTRIHNLYCL